MGITYRMLEAGEAKGRIEEWLSDEGFSLWKFPDKDSNFSYKIRRDNCHPLVVLQPKKKNDSMQIACDIRLKEEEQKKLQRISEVEKRFMLFDFRMLLLSTGCQWQFTPASESWSNLRIWKSIFYDGLTKDRFFETINIVTRAVSSITLTLEWKFNIEPYVS